MFLQKISFYHFLFIKFQNFDSTSTSSPNTELDSTILGVLRATRDLRQQLCQTTLEQASELGHVTKAGLELVSTIRALALTNDIDSLQRNSDRFHEYLDHILEVSFVLFVRKIESCDCEKVKDFLNFLDIYKL